MVRAVNTLRSMDLHGDRGIALVRGEGAHLFDADGREYIDMMSNYGVNILGHGDAEIAAAVAEQAARLGNAHQSFGNDARAAFLDALGALMPAPLSRVCFTNSGAESLEAALKFARAATGRQRIVAMHRGYHGRTMGALALTAERKYRDPFLPMLEGIVHVPFDDADAVAAVLDDTVAAVVVEPIQGEAGVRVPGEGYLRALRDLCTGNGSLLVLDEVQTGFRTGRVFAFEAEGIVPDILCLSKGLANGFPMGVTVTTEAVNETIPRAGHGSTFAGNPLACAAGTVTLRRLADAALHERVAAAGERFLGRLRAIDAPVIREVRGRGFMIAVELRRPAGQTIRALQDAGVIALPAGSTTIRFLPPLIVSDADIDATVERLVSVLAAG